MPFFGDFLPDIGTICQDPTLQIEGTAQRQTQGGGEPPLPSIERGRLKE
jgi:hypothetical protein